MPAKTVVRLRNRREVAERTMAFDFEKPAGFTFRAGQFLELTLVDPPENDEAGNVRAFSIASAPHEEVLTVATRVRDTAFKRVLKNAPLGSAVQIEGPFGDLVLHNNPARPAVLIDGGRYRDYALPQHRAARRGRETAAPHLLVLCKPEA